MKVLQVLCPLLFCGFCLLKFSGEVDLTKKTTGHGCNCHGAEVPSNSVKVWIDGPRVVQPNIECVYRIFITGGPALAGGFNVAAWKGKLNAIDEGTRIELVGNNWELTHYQPREFINDTVSWKFSYIAPDTLEWDTLYAVGNSVDLDGLEFGDEYNFSDNFPVHVVSTECVNSYDTPVNFYIKQNYPNPFNSSTTIEFYIPSPAIASFDLYDVLGKKTETMYYGCIQGSHSIKLDASNLVSGVYFYTMSINNKRFVKKLILQK